MTEKTREFKSSLSLSRALHSAGALRAARLLHPWTDIPAPHAYIYIFLHNITVTHRLLYIFTAAPLRHPHCIAMRHGTFAVCFLAGSPPPPRAAASSSRIWFKIFLCISSTRSVVLQLFCHTHRNLTITYFFALLWCAARVCVCVHFCSPAFTSYKKIRCLFFVFIKFFISRWFFRLFVILYIFVIRFVFN